MQEHTVYGLVERIYDTFGRPVPKRESGQVQVLMENVQDIPDVCATYIARRISDMDDLPRNLSKFFWVCWEIWKAENPQSVAKETCPECGGSGGTYFFRMVERAGKEEWHNCFSPCPYCTWIPPEMRDRIKPLCRTKQQLHALETRDATILVLPDNYKGNVAKFRLDMQWDAAQKNPRWDGWLEGFRQRFRQGRALAEEGRR